MAQTVRLPAKGDATIRSDMVNRNVNTDQLTTNASARRALMHFNLKSLPTDAVVMSATLRMTLKNAWTGSNEITAERITEKWAEPRVTWANQPAVSALNVATETVTGGVALDTVDIDVTDMVNAAVARNRPWHGIRLRVDTASNRKFFSSEAHFRARRPVLILSYSTPPPQPTRLAPRALDAVNAAEPKLAWEAEEQSEFWIQMDPADPTDTPSYDTDWIVSDERGVDLDSIVSPNFPAMGDEDNMYWRVKVKNEDGLESPWSKVVQFERHVYGTLSITDPSPDGAAVDGALPTITTTFSGQTQERLGWQVQRRSAGDDRYIVTASDSFTNGFATTESDFELTHGAIDEPDADYVLFVRVWDDRDRGTAVGERSYVEVSRPFVYGPTAGTSSVTNLLAQQVEQGDPRVRLTWDRASAPDSYDVYIDGRMFAQELDPDDLFTSGTSYMYDVWGAKPREEHIFTVVPTEAGVDDDGPADVTYTPSVIGIWLCVPSEDFAMMISEKDSVTMSLGETAGEFTPMGRRAVVRIVDTMRGLEGSVSGTLVEYNGVTARTWRRRLLELKELDPSIEIRLVLSRHNFPVLLGDVSVSPSPIGEELYSCTVDFWQVGEFEVDW